MEIKGHSVSELFLGVYPFERNLVFLNICISADNTIRLSALHCFSFFISLLCLTNDAFDCSRSTRESTPSSLIRNPDIIRTPSSTTRPTTSAIETNHRNPYSSNRHIPTAREMDEFFALAEEKQQRHFIEKYVNMYISSVAVKGTGIVPTSNSLQ